MERHLRAPTTLDLEARAALRREADALLERMAGPGVLVIDLRDTAGVDSAGLGALVMIQRRAQADGHVVRLSGLRAEIRSVLALSRLLELFEISE